MSRRKPKSIAAPAGRIDMIPPGGGPAVNVAAAMRGYYDELGYTEAGAAPAEVEPATRKEQPDAGS